MKTRIEYDTEAEMIAFLDGFNYVGHYDQDSWPPELKDGKWTAVIEADFGDGDEQSDEEFKEIEDGEDGDEDDDSEDADEDAE